MDVNYWIERGVTENLAKQIVKNYTPPPRTLETYIQLFGPTDGPKRLSDVKKRSIATRIKHFRTAESKRYFLPLYRILRKAGIQKEDIRWGAGRKREFMTKHPKLQQNFAYDFVVLSKRVIIEYNNVFGIQKKMAQRIGKILFFGLLQTTRHRQNQKTTRRIHRISSIVCMV